LRDVFRSGLLVLGLTLLGSLLGLPQTPASAQDSLPERSAPLEESLISVLGLPSMRVHLEELVYLFFPGGCQEGNCDTDDYVVLERGRILTARLNETRRADLLQAGIILFSASDEPRAGEERRRVRAFRLPDGDDLLVDGRLDESVWDLVEFSSGFLTQGSDRGHPAEERTEVAFLYDEEALYVGARMFSLSPADLHPLVGRRDQPGATSQLLISLNSDRDRRTAYTFGVSVGGTRIDYHHAEDEENSRDYSFDPVWEGRATIHEEGWSVEMRIPFSQLRFQQPGPQIWGVNVKRAEPERYTNDYWVVVPLNQAGWASRFGELVGLEIAAPTRRVEFLPYITGSGTAPLGSEASPWRPQETLWRTGADLKFGIAPNLTFEATVNPDFGQVEVDPASVNLTAFETFFPERRPFFVEGGALLKGRGQNYFYSRRIGSIPSGTMSSGYVDQPRSSRIIGATKLTGRFNSGFSIGGIAAVTAREWAGVNDRETGELLPVEVAPLTRFGVVRLQQEFGAGGSTAGLIVTAVHRDLNPGNRLTEILSRSAISGGADWTLRFADGAYQLSGDVGYSFIEGDSVALLKAQNSSARYFQRPDADYVAVDPFRRSLFGYAGSMRLAKVAGARWLWELSSATKSPGFEINDAGALGVADRIESSATVRYRHHPVAGPFHGYEFALFSASGWNYGGARQFTSPGLFGSVTWRNLLSTYAQIGIETRATSDKVTWGGPLVATPFGTKASVGLSTDYAARTRWSANGAYFRDEWGQRSYSVHGGVALRPSSRLSLGVDPGFAQLSDARYLLTALPFGGPATFGKRYIFTSFARSDLYAQLRLEYAFKPDLTIQFYGMPLASSGRFYEYGELTAPRTGELQIYKRGSQIRVSRDGSVSILHPSGDSSLGNPDYNIRWLNSNLVLRWEWQPGSMFFMIWQQGRYGFDQDLGMIGPMALWDVMTEPGSNSLALKFTYRIAGR